MVARKKRPKPGSIGHRATCFSPSPRYDSFLKRSRRGARRRRVAPDEPAAAWRRPGTRGPLEVTRRMFEPDARRPLAAGRPRRSRRRSRTKNLPVSRAATRSGTTSPTTSGTTGAGRSQNAIRSVRQLRDLLPFTPDELEAIGRLEAEYKLAIPPYYFSLIDPDDPNDPIRLQSVPSPLEAENPSGYELEDPLEEDKDSPVPGLTHRYPDRVLLVTTPRLHHVLPLLHPQAGDHGPRRLGRRQPRRRADDRVRPRPPARSATSSSPAATRSRCRSPSSSSSSTTWRRSRTSTSSASAPACRSRCRRSSTTRS